MINYLWYFWMNYLIEQIHYHLGLFVDSKIQFRHKF